MSGTHPAVSGDEVEADRRLLDAVTEVASAEQVSRSPHGRGYRVLDAAGGEFMIKLVHPSTAERAVRLAAALAGFGGANPVLSHGEVDGFGYLVHAWHPAVVSDLVADLVHHQGVGMAPRAVADLLEPVAAALERLNRLGYVHGDVKPGNLLVSRDGSALLCDLDEATPEGTVRLRWTPGWAAPEVVAGRPAGPGADRWGFALVVVALLAGAEVAATALREGPAEVLARHLPAPLAGGLASDLDRHPGRRDVSGPALIRALRSIAIGREGSRPTRPDGLQPPPTRQSPAFAPSGPLASPPEAPPASPPSAPPQRQGTRRRLPVVPPAPASRQPDGAVVPSAPGPTDDRRTEVGAPSTPGSSQAAVAAPVADPQRSATPAQPDAAVGDPPSAVPVAPVAVPMATVAEDEPLAAEPGAGGAAPSGLGASVMLPTGIDLHAVTQDRPLLLDGEPAWREDVSLEAAPGVMSGVARRALVAGVVAAVVLAVAGIVLAWG